MVTDFAFINIRWAVAVLYELEGNTGEKLQPYVKAVAQLVTAAAACWAF